MICSIMFGSVPRNFVTFFGNVYINLISGKFQSSLNSKPSNKKQKKEQQGDLQISVNIFMDAKIHNCAAHPDIGPCRGAYTRYAYNRLTGRCENFTYGGCRGNRNNFLTESDCLLTCVTIGKKPLAVSILGSET